MRKSVLFIMVLLMTLFSVEFVFADYSLTSCSDSDGDDPNTPGYSSWEATEIEGTLSKPGSEPSRSTGSSTDICDQLHYVNVLLYSGVDIGWGESVLVENVCPDIGTTGSDPGDVQWQTMKFYKCNCENTPEEKQSVEDNLASPTSHFCLNTAEEIPMETVREADENWMQAGRRELHPTLARF